MRKILVPPVLLLLCAIGMFLANRYLPDGHLLKQVWLSGMAQKAGYLLILIGIYLPVHSARIFKQEETNILPYKSPDTMVTRGPFGYTRNPMYLGMLLVLLGIATHYGIVAGLLLCGVFFCVANWWFIPFEEAKMANAFGDAFTEYKNKVRRWL